jgi:hypothetical protein
MEETESKEKTEGAIEDSIISLFLTVDDMKICGRPFFFFTNRFTSCNRSKG